MEGCELSNSASMGVWDSPLPPCVQALRGQPELLPDEIGADGVDQGVMGRGFGEHASKYQRSVYIARGQTFIGRAAVLMHKLSVAHDPEFGARLRTLIPLAGYKNPRRFAIDGMGWDADGGPQKLNNYMKGRIPDVETLVQMAAALKVSVTDLLGVSGTSAIPDEGLKGILRHLLELEGISPDKADTIANVSLAAQRLLQVFPDEEPLLTRVKFAARAAWHQRQPQERHT